MSGRVDNLETGLSAEITARETADSGLSDRIDALEALTGSTNSALQSISSGDTSVTVSAKDANNNQTVAVNVSQVSDNALELKSDGLFAAVYYEDDDPVV